MLKAHCMFLARQGKIVSLSKSSSKSKLVRSIHFDVQVARPWRVDRCRLPFVTCRGFSFSNNERYRFVPSWTWELVPGRDSSQYISRPYICQTSTSFQFDTHKLVKKLQEKGFTLEQAECVTSALSEVMEFSLGKVTTDTVSKLEQERLEMRMKGSVDDMKHEMFLLEKIKFAAVQENTEKLREEVIALKDMLRDQVSTLKGGVALDFSLEKSRVKEEIAERDQKIKDTNNRIETELAKLGTQLEAQKLDLIKYLVGSILSCFTLFLAVWRFLKM